MGFSLPAAVEVAHSLFFILVSDAPDLNLRHIILSPLRLLTSRAALGPASGRLPPVRWEHAALSARYCRKT